MTGGASRARLETESLVIGYAMSRLDAAYLSARGAASWQQAFAEAAGALGQPPATYKNLRDEFDPVHDNTRRGWHARALRPSRQRVLDELRDVSDDALLELTARILSRDEDATAEAIDSLAAPSPRIAHNVAERLLTGRLAEEYFLSQCRKLVQVEPEDIVDMRQAARGFDFGVRDHPEQAIEVKGLKPLHGDILFTDREWTEAKFRRENYWLVVVGNLAAEPLARVLRDPHAALAAKCALHTSITAVWRAAISVHA